MRAGPEMEDGDPLGDQEGSTISIQEEETEIATETIIKVTKVTSQDRCQTTGKTVVCD